MPTTLTITLDDNGQISINGPINNKLLSVGLLELSKAAILHGQTQEQRVIPATMLPPFGNPQA